MWIYHLILCSYNPVNWHLEQLLNLWYFPISSMQICSNASESNDKHLNGYRVISQILKSVYTRLGHSGAFTILFWAHFSFNFALRLKSMSYKERYHSNPWYLAILGWFSWMICLQLIQSFLGCLICAAADVPPEAWYYHNCAMGWGWLLHGQWPVVSAKSNSPQTSVRTF